jgi:hypothetical protein
MDRHWTLRVLRALAAAGLVVGMSGCAAGMGAMMAGGGMHGEGPAGSVPVALFAPDRVLAQADGLRLTADQVVALQRLRDSQRDGLISAEAAAQGARNALTNDQIRMVERRQTPAGPAAPAHRHEDEAEGTGAHA